MPNDGLNDADGGRLQSWLKRRVEVRSRTNGEGFPRPELGLIIARYYKDDTTGKNKSGIYTEYDVYMPRFQIVLYNVPMLTAYQGVDGGLQITLKVGSTPDASNPRDFWRQVMDNDGDLVSVSYIGGSFPVITGCVNHIRTSGAADWQTGDADGEVYSLSYNTTRCRINDDGNVDLDLADTPSHDRRVIIRVDGTPFVTVSQDGTTGDVRVDVGSGGQKVILGEAFKTWFNALYPVHIHASSGAPPTVPSPAPPNLPFEMDDTVLTEKLKVEP